MRFRVMRARVLVVAACVLFASCGRPTDQDLPAAAGTSENDRIYLPLPSSADASQLCVQVTAEWRVNQYAAVKQRRTSHGGTRTLETGAVILDVADPKLKGMSSAIWPFPSTADSALGTLFEKYSLRFTAGIAGYDDLTAFPLLVQIRTAPGAPWQTLGPAEQPLWQNVEIEWIATGVIASENYTSQRIRADEHPEIAEAVVIRLKSRATETATDIDLEEVPYDEKTVFETVINQWTGQTIDGSKGGVYLLGLDISGVLRASYLSEPAEGPWDPQVRLIPIPVVWNQDRGEWENENSSAVILPPWWRMEDGLDASVLDTTDLPRLAGRIDTDQIAHLDVPAQVLAPAWPPRSFTDKLKDRHDLAYLKGAALKGQAWDVARVLTAEALRPHRRVDLALLSPEADPDDWRFVVYHQAGSSGEASWQRITGPAGDGFTELSLFPRDNKLHYQGRRRHRRWATAENEGQVDLTEELRLLVVVLPPERVYGPTQQLAPR